MPGISRCSRRGRSSTCRSSRRRPRHCSSLPLTSLDPGTAFRVWSMIELILLALGVWVAIRAGPWPSAHQAGSACRHLLIAVAGGRNLRVPPPRPDRRTSRRSGWAPPTRHGGRTGRAPPGSGWRSRSRRPSRTSRSGSASGCSRAATGERLPGPRPAAHWWHWCRWRWSVRVASPASRRRWASRPATRLERAHSGCPGWSLRGSEPATAQ